MHLNCLGPSESPLYMHSSVFCKIWLLFTEISTSFNKKINSYVYFVNRYLEEQKAENGKDKDQKVTNVEKEKK